MTSSTPKVSVGLPVYNGADYLDGAIESILNQTFTDLELIICDNASTDETPDIIEKWAKRDSRIFVHRNPENLGGAANFNKVMKLARGRYFRWTGHDDLLDPTMIEECVTVLDEADDSVALVAPTTTFIDGEGTHTGVTNPLELTEPGTVSRFSHALRRVGRGEPLFGLMRTGVVQSIGGMGTFPSADLLLMSELALRGRFIRIEKPLFYRRIHPEASWHASGKYEGFAEWFDPKASRRLVFPSWRLWWEMIRSPFRAPIPWSQRLICSAVAVVVWPRRKRRKMLEELKRVPGVVQANRRG